jgi:hypothetical protein
MPGGFRPRHLPLPRSASPCGLTRIRGSPRPADSRRSKDADARPGLGDGWEGSGGTRCLPRGEIDRNQPGDLSGLGARGPRGIDSGEPSSSIEDAAREVGRAELIRSASSSRRIPIICRGSGACSRRFAGVDGLRDCMKGANEPKELYLVRGSEHNDLEDVGGEGLVGALQRFVQRRR